MDVTFLRPLYLTFLVSVPFFIIMHFMILQHVRRRALNFANFEIIERVTGGQVMNKNLVILIIRLCALILFTFSAAGTIFWYDAQTSDFDYVIAIDASSSMLADDFDPNRIEATKRAAVEFVDNLPPHTTVGLISFAGTSFVEQPLTSDSGLIKDKIMEVGIKPVGGTDLGEALVTATNMLLFDERARSIILLTDGQSNVGTDPEFGAEYANEHHVTVFTIGMATTSGGQFSQIEAISRLDEDTLKLIARNTGGIYYRAENQEELQQAYNDIAGSTEQKVSSNLQLPLLLLALFLLFLEWGLINTKYRTLP